MGSFLTPTRKLGAHEWGREPGFMSAHSTCFSPLRIYEKVCFVLFSLTYALPFPRGEVDALFAMEHESAFICAGEGRPFPAECCFISCSDQRSV
eukprot:jgi/Botrbrau1/5165/Bobra.0172s0037.1